MNRYMHYILDENNNPVPEPDTIKWGKWYEQAERHVGDTHIGDIHISTVFLSLPHLNKEPGNDDVMLYETMVFASDEVITKLMELSETDDRSIVAMFTDDVDIQKRYATREQAIEGHKNMCVFVETCITKGLIQP